MAKDKKLSIVVKAKDLASKTFKKLKRQVRLLGSDLKTAAKFVVGFGAAVLAMSAVAVREWGKQEKAVAGLRQVLKSMGRETPGLERRILDTAAALQELGIGADDAIIEGTKFLATYKQISDEQLPEVMAVMTDFVALTGKDMPQAANILGKAAMGMTGELAQYGITLSDAAKESKDFTLILAEIKTQVEGQDAALRATTAGSLTAFKNIVGDIVEQLGRFISSIMNAGIVDWLITFAKVAGEAFSQFVDNFTETGDASKETSGIMIKSFKFLARAIAFTVGAMLDTWNLLKVGFHGVVLIIGRAMEGLFDMLAQIARALAPFSDTVAGVASTMENYRVSIRSVNDEMTANIETNFDAIGAADKYLVKVDDLIAKTDELATGQFKINLADILRPGATAPGDIPAADATGGKELERFKTREQMFREHWENVLGIQNEGWTTQQGLTTQMVEAEIQSYDMLVKGMGNATAQGFTDMAMGAKDGEKKLLASTGRLINQIANVWGDLFIAQGGAMLLAPGMRGQGAALVGKGIALKVLGGVIAASLSGGGGGGGGGGGAGGSGGGGGAVPGAGTIPEAGRGRTRVTIIVPDDGLMRPTDLARNFAESLGPLMNMDVDAEIIGSSVVD
jgi:hypothetical protein